MKSVKINAHLIANDAGVSQSTVSRIFRNPALVSSETYNRVIESVNKHNYAPPIERKGYTQNNIRHRVKKQNGKMIGFIVFSQKHEEAADSEEISKSILTGIQLQGASMDLFVKLYHPNSFSLLPCEDAVQNDENLKNGSKIKSNAARIHNLKNNSLDGLLVAGAVTPSILQNLSKYVKKILLLGTADHLNIYPSIIFNDFQGIYAATSHLISLNHHQIVYCRHETSMPSLNRQDYGYRCAMTDAHIKPQPHLVVPANGSEETIINNICMQLQDYKSLPTGIIASDDKLAYKIILACRRLQIEIPKQLSLIGYGDHDFSNYIQPTLSTVHVNKELMGRIATKLLDSMIDDTDDTIQPAMIMTLPVSLIHRQSCGICRE